MTYIDDMKGQTGDFTQLKTRYEELKSKETSGNLDDKGKLELQQLREHFDKKEG